MLKSSFMKDGLPTIAPKDVPLTKEALLIDVRRPDEFTGDLGHVEGAKLATLGPELEVFLSSASKEQPIIFICRSGGRSGQATAMAKNSGFQEVYNMEGGMLNWTSQGLPVQR